MIKHVFYILLLTLPILAQAQDTKILLHQYFKEVRANKYPPISVSFSLPENAKKILIEVKPFYNDTSANVRTKAYGIIRYVGDKSRVTTVREECVNMLVKASKDKDAGNVGTVLGYLTQFLKQDFSNESLNGIRRLLKSNPPHVDKVMRLAGFLQLEDMKDFIRPYAQPGNSQPIRWSAIVSLARMGDAEALDEMMRRTKKIKVNDDVVYEVFPDLIYTHQRVAYDYLVEVLMQEDKNCISAHPDREEPIQCGYRVMEQLAPVVEGYPLKVHASGDLITDDYVGALITVRNWFGENKNYKILRDTY